MNFNLSQEQELLKSAARDLLSRECPTSLVRAMEEEERGFADELWRKIADLGWLGLPFPPEEGGAGGGFLDLTVLLEELGRALAPVPFFSSVVLGGLPLSKFGGEALRKEIVPRAAAGEAILTFALLEPGGSYTPEGITTEARPAGDGYRLSGEKTFVENAHLATHTLVPARAPGTSGAEGVTVFVVEAGVPGLSVTPLKPMSLEGFGHMALDDVAVPEARVAGGAGEGWPIVEQALEWGIAGRCAMALGGAEAVLAQTVEYAKGRVQFGQPIGSFQAVQHHAANLYADVETMRLITYELAWLLDEDRPRAQEVSMAKAWVAEAYTRMTRTAIQIHGGIGMSKEMDPQLYFRRAKTWETLYGSPDRHRELIAQGM